MQNGGHFDVFECSGEYFISHEKSGHVIQKEDVW